MADVSTWDPADESNNKPPPDGWPEFMMPSQVNNSARMMMGATKRMYDQLVAGTLVLPYLKLAGGAGGQTVTGPVTFAGITAAAITSNGTINAASTISTGGAISAAGAVSGGSISTGGAISGNSLVANAITSNGALAAGSYDMAGAALARVSSASTLLYDRANNWCIQLDNGGISNYANNTHHFYSRGTGADYGFWNSGGLTVYAAIAASGAISGGSLGVTGAISANTIGANYIGSNGNINAAGAFTGGSVSVGTVSATNGNISGVLTLADTGHQIMADGGTKYYQFQSGWNWAWNRSNGTLIWTGSTAFWVMRTTDWLCFNAIGTVGGMGDYYNASDLRFKEPSSIGPATAGLDAILQLQPVRFKRMARSFAPSEPSVAPPTPRWEIGFIAQDVQDIIPEAVAAVGIELPDGTGGPGDPEPTLALGNTALVAALVNAIKTIDQRLTAGGL